ncbi:hypothetical protein HKT18_13685 [Flavobacterium sp. IMCC34852]|uniref:Uncharacterized protein n=1 Tax=Flavobacterium rivulicola TaxID=2732161 RepID=A0A7Y3RC30_9FLAO|nr:hypothetical protein [Flavobacterium sp. IMCC34852]NNT73266.1 hypothetical protein [Flavobacterium sp. IMCC34852]
MKYLLLFFTCTTFAQVQKFIPIDNETLEFISEVNYTLYANKKPIFSNLTSKDSITRLPKDITFDSICFNKLNYKTIGYKKENLTEIILLTKTAYDLDEVIIPNSKPKEIVIGEECRFVKRKSSILTANPDYGLIFRENDLKNKVIKRLTFFVEKVKYKTTYKIKFYAAHETGNFMTLQYLELNELLFESPIFTIEKGTKNKVEINLEDYDINITDKNIFACLELQSYYDDNNTAIQPETKDGTRLKFQLSNLANYYSKTYDINTKKTSDYVININAMINRDFAFMFFKKPHKSELVAPAIILYATKTNEHLKENK